MDPHLSPHETTVVQTARAFAADQVRPHAARWELERTVPVDTFRAAAAAGLSALLVPQALGGQGLGYTAFARVTEELAAACLPFAFMLVVHNNLAGNIARNGAPHHHERWLPPMIRGDRIGAFCLTEPGAGSDAAAITTLATPAGEGWRIAGEKAWVTNGAVAGLLSVYAQTEPDAGSRGIVCLLVEGDAPGLERGDPYAMLAGHAMGTCGLTLRDVRVPPEHLLIPAGQAFRAAMQGIDLARTTVGAMCCGMLRTGLDVALHYATERKVFGRAVADHQGVQWQLAEVATELAAARALTYAATQALDAGAPATLAAAHAKKFASRAALSGLNACMQVLGANGLRAEYPLGRHLASAKIAQYLDGTTEIQNVVIARALLRDLAAAENT